MQEEAVCTVTVRRTTTQGEGEMAETTTEVVEDTTVRPRFDWARLLGPCTWHVVMELIQQIQVDENDGDVLVVLRLGFSGSPFVSPMHPELDQTLHFSQDRQR